MYGSRSRCVVAALGVAAAILLTPAVSASAAPRSKAAAETDCQAERRQALQREDPDASSELIVQCWANGDYSSLQCFPATPTGKSFCMCYDPDGRQLTPPSQKTTRVDCDAKVAESRRHKQRD
ncbi:hypothetical protein F3087_45630 [Nocardia colli]|uniref:Thyroglobulin type-1 domain-containing protein n=1 Tax=Nocardia colli TaxID=2545717 RepID=A0A5N0DKH5_9NOCA|nr:hypothetical protein F3087_45630 [Nocardia colli]